MKIKNFNCISADANVEYEIDRPICFFCGRGSDTFMDLMREMIGDCMPHTVLYDEDRHYVLHADVEIGGKAYRVCYIHNAEGGENRIAVNHIEYSLVFSREDTAEYVQLCNRLNKSSVNVLIGTAAAEVAEDTRPIFIYDYFDRLDEAVDITPMLDALVALDRQVFVAVCGRYRPIEHPDVQICTIDLVS